MVVEINKVAGEQQKYKPFHNPLKKRDEFLEIITCYLIRECLSGGQASLMYTFVWNELS